MWRKFAGPLFHGSMFRLTDKQRMAVQAQVAVIAADPYDKKLNPIHLDTNIREIEVAGIWLRYQIDERDKRVVFLQASI